MRRKSGEGEVFLLWVSIDKVVGGAWVVQKVEGCMMHDVEYPIIEVGGR